MPDANGYTLRDLNSTNGTFVNGQPTRERKLLNGDVIHVGSLEVRYESDVTNQADASLQASKLQYAPIAEGSRRSQGVPPVITVGAMPVESRMERHSGGVALPIPPRTQPLPPRIHLAVASHRNAHDIGIRFEIGYSTGADEFVRKAQKYVGRRETHAQFVSFMSYWPTYGSMTNAQQRWYFYWRDQVRNGVYPDTDLSYVFVHVYELINNVGTKNGSDGYQQLHTLWLGYRDRYRKLDNYLVDWLADYAVLNECPVDPMNGYFEAFELRGFVREPDLLLPRFLNGSTVPLPLALITSLADYRIHHSKFYLGGKQSLVEELIPKALNCVNSQMKEREGAGIFEKFKPAEPRVIQRYPFQSAVYAGRTNLTTIATVFPYSRCLPLRTFLTAVVKHAENCLRELRNYRGRLRGYNLPPETKLLIEEFLKALATPPPPRQRIVVDLSRVEELARDSDEVREMLLAGRDVPQPCDGKRADEAIEPPVPKRPEGTPAHLLTDLEPVQKILVRIGAEETRLLEFLMRQQWVADESLLAMDLPGVLQEQTIDRVNELAKKFLGDVLIACEGTKRVVTDDYRDELEFLIAQNSSKVRAPAQPGKPIEGLPEGWIEFLRQLQDHQLRVLSAIVAKVAALDEIRKIAADKATMPEALIDSINDLAQSTVGDIIIDTTVVPPVVEEEDIEMVNKVLSAAIGDTRNGND
jgi:hypothetical protein